MANSYLPKDMQFEPMNYLYEDGMNPWSIAQYPDKSVIFCGAPKEFTDIVSMNKPFPKEVLEFVNQQELPIEFREYPENIITSMKLVRNESGYVLDFLVDL